MVDLSPERPDLRTERADLSLKKAFVRLRRLVWAILRSKRVDLKS